MDVETDAAAAMAMIPAGSLSYCSCSVVDVAITVVAADIFGRQRLFPLPFLMLSPLFFSVLFFFFLFQTLQIYLIKGIAVQNQLLLFFIQFLSLPDLLSIYYM